MNSVSELLTPLLRGMATQPKHLRINEILVVGRPALAVLPHTDDYRIICGGGGRTIKALTSLTYLLGQKLGTPTDLVLTENFQYERLPNKPFVPNDEFDTDSTIALVKKFCAVVFDRAVPITWNKSPNALEIYLGIDPASAKESAIAAILHEAFYPYGYRQGCFIRIKALKKTPK